MGYTDRVDIGARTVAQDLDQSQPEARTDWSDQFPVCKRLIYLNHAAVAPLCRPAAETMQWLVGDAMEFGSLHYEEWLAAYEGLRKSSARLIGAEPEEIAIVKNTSEGIATVALGLDWKAGDAVVAFREEFPANYYPWERLGARGVELRWLSVFDPLEKVEELVKGARLLAISFVQYLSGYRADLKRLGEICHRHGAFFFVDAIQGLGVFPIDVRECKVDALAADGHKWLLGPEGCGILYVARQWQDRIEPVEFGWTNTARYFDYASRDMTLRPDAGRYECGTLNTVGIFGLRAAIDFLLQVGCETIERGVLERAGLVANAAARKGYELLGPRQDPGTLSGIVTVRKPGVDMDAVCRQLRREHRVIASPRQGYIRFSPHFYLPIEQLEQLAEALP